jgi:iron(II)-dependent oxidoreductase
LSTEEVEQIASELQEARERTRYLLSTLSEEELARQHSEIMSPLVWDLWHIGYFEELWLLQNLKGKDPTDSNINDLYDATLYARSERPSLDLMDREEAERFLDEVRSEVLESLRETDFGDGPLTRGGMVYRLVLQHECQHTETMLQTLQLMEGQGYRPGSRIELPPGDGAADGKMVCVPDGPFVMGTDDTVWAYDNERPAHEVNLPAFYIDKTPVTNRAYLHFVEDGGYERPEFWSEAGWEWRRSEGVHSPMYWYQKEPQDWWSQRFGFDEPLGPLAPVQHVSFHEAEAYARWAGKRLPTEAEWEKAASWDPEMGTRRRFPWGAHPPTPELANLDQLAFRPAEAGAYPAGASPCGALGMFGDVWEWTASEFTGYPGFRPFPYREYSEIFFDDGYRVLRGGSWATRPQAIRSTFRNWDLPIRRQLFCGFRCARDA